MMPTLPSLKKYLNALFCKKDSSSVKTSQKITVERFDKRDYKITLENGHSYVGNSTVWHSFPSGERAGTRLEGRLSDIIKREEWRMAGKLETSKQQGPTP
jgi:hypothetical protein